MVASNDEDSPQEDKSDCLEPLVCTKISELFYRYHGHAHDHEHDEIPPPLGFPGW